MKLMLNGKEVSGMGHYVMAGDIKDATAEDSNVLSGKVYYNNNGKREGTMPNRGGMRAELAAGGSTTIPEGYHNGEGVVRAQDLASQTTGDAEAGDIASGKTAYVNGNKLTGSLVVPAMNDWDPYEMEEEVMLDLSNYTYVGILSIDSNVTLNGTYIFIIASNSNTISELYINNNCAAVIPAGGAECLKLALKNVPVKVSGAYQCAYWKKN